MATGGCYLSTCINTVQVIRRQPAWVGWGEKSYKGKHAGTKCGIIYAGGSKQMYIMCPQNYHLFMYKYVWESFLRLFHM